LSSDRVWDKTHKLGGRLFKLAGLIALVGVFFGSFAIVFVMVPVMMAAVYLVAYSYVEYRKEVGSKLS